MSLRRAFAVALALLAVPLATGCASVPLEKQPWLEVRTEHFRIVSQVEAEQAVKLARSLERFQQVVRKMTNVKDFAPRVPTTILLFDDRRAYLEIAPEYTLGFFLPGQRANYALVDATGTGINANSVLLHEYTHYLVNNDQVFSYPGWYNEGFAELMSGTVEKETTISVGRALPDRVSSLASSSALPLRRVMTESPNSQEKTLVGLYYAKAWLLVHRLKFGSEAGLPDRSKQLGQYLLRVHEGMPPEQACQAAFGVDFVELDAELGRYLRKSSYRGSARIPSFELPLSALPETAPPKVRSLRADEVAGELGGVALQLGRGARAEPLFRAELALRPDSARAHIGLADALRMQKRKGEYEPLYERGLELGADDALSQLDYGEYLMDSAKELEDSAVQQRRELLTRARVHLRRAIELAPELPEAHAQLGVSYLVFPDDRDVEQGLQSVQRANQLLASDVEITYLMALANLRANRVEDARRFIALARSRAHDEVPEVERLAEEIEAARVGATPAPAQPGVGATP